MWNFLRILFNAQLLDLTQEPRLYAQDVRQDLWDLCRIPTAHFGGRNALWCGAANYGTTSRRN